MRRFRNLLATATIAAFAATTSSASAVGPTVLGFNDDLGAITRAAPAVAGTSEVARITLNWAGVRRDGWSQVDAAVGAARASGQRLFFTATGIQAPDLS